jgi:hypothetical protein
MEFLRMTAKEYRQQFTKNKYHAQKTEVGGITFDSKKEAKDGLKLQQLASTGVISNLQRQVKFVLQEGYRNSQGKAIRPICYIADFVYERDGKKYVQDSKGVRTEVYKIKRKIFEKKYPEYIFLET